MKLYLSILVALLCTASVGLAQAPRAATITGKIHNPPTREIEFRYTSSLSPTRSELLVVLDSENRFALTFPVPRGTLVMGRYKDPQPPKWSWLEGLRSFVFGPRAQLILFVEPGDSLHIEMNEGHFSSSPEFSGQGADNNRFIAKILPDYLDYRPDYEGLALKDFIRQAEQRRQDEFEWLAKGREKYELSAGFIDYATARFNYEWAREMISYPTNYRSANHPDNRDITPEYYDFLQDIPLVDEKAIGTGEYRTFLERTLDWESNKGIEAKYPKLSETYDLSGFEWWDSVQTQLDSLYEKDGLNPSLSKMVSLSALGLSDSVQTQLDSLYEKDGRRLKLSQMVNLSKFGISKAAAQAQLDSLYEKEGHRSCIISSSEEEAPRVDTTGGTIAFYIPSEVPMDSLRKEPPKLSEKLDLSRFGLSDSAQAQFDSLYEHRQLLNLSEKLDLSGLGLSAAAQAQLDSIYADENARTWLGHWRSYDLAKQKLEGRVLYWFLAGELIAGFERGKDFAFVHRKWEKFKETNPYPEYNEAIEAALGKALVLQPGQPAPDFTLADLDGQPVSLSQFQGKAVFLDFWASWCGPCIGDLSDLRKIKKETAEQAVVFLNISLDDDEEAWKKAVAKYEIKGVHLRAAGWGADVAKAYSIHSLPSYYLVDAQGRIAERLRAVYDTQEIVAKIAESTKAAGG